MEIHNERGDNTALNDLKERHELRKQARAEQPIVRIPLSEAAKAARRDKVEKIIAKLRAELGEKQG